MVTTAGWVVADADAAAVNVTTCVAAADPGANDAVTPLGKPLALRTPAPRILRFLRWKLCFWRFHRVRAKCCMEKLKREGLLGCDDKGDLVVEDRLPEVPGW